VHWRILLDLADFAKRDSKFTEAKLLFKLITYVQPYAYQGWLEFAKMQEESGMNDSAQAILQAGLRFNPLNDNLFVKAIKVEERARRVDQVRSLLGGLREEKFERAWRMILEGALFEGRAGNKLAARKAFRYLVKNCQSYGPIYLEASKYEEREGEVEKALELCEEGLQYNAKYGPLWF
jgi:tetratricopeptide (TPR) repeat protein